MKRKSRFTVLVLTAALTFGTLFALKGHMYKHHWQQRSEHCAKDSDKNCTDKSQFNTSDEAVIVPSDE